MKELFVTILEMSIAAGITACAVTLIRLLLKKAPKVFSYALWALVLFRLVCPFTFESAFSLVPASGNALTQVISQPPAVPDNNPFPVNPANTTGGQRTPQMAVMPARAADPIGATEVLAYIWVAGILVMFGYAIFSYTRLKIRLKTATLRTGNIYESDRIAAPFVLGFFSPRIYLPAGLDDVDYILRHEQTHIRRRDYIIKPFAFCALCLHWFNPVIWVSYILMCRDMEMSCDESVLKRSDFDIRRDYSGSLLAMSEKQNGLIGPLAFGESNTKIRIRNVLKYRKPSLFISVTAILVMICMAACFAPTRSQQDDPEPEPPAPVTYTPALPEQGETVPNEVTPSPVQPTFETGAEPTGDFAALPDTKLIQVLAEGEPYELGYLTVSEQGYAMYVLEGWMMTSGEDGDKIQWGNDPSNYYMRIFNADAAARTLEYEMVCPDRPEREPLAAMSPMYGTIVWPDGSGVFDEADPIADEQDKDYLAMGFDLMETEKMGGIYYGMPENDVIALLGEPTTKQAPELWGADGLYHWDYVYESLGLTVGFAGATGESGEILSYYIQSTAFAVSTERGIRIGSTRQDVLDAYKNEIPPVWLAMDGGSSKQIVAGSIYGGIVFHFSDEDTVNSISVGAAAE